MIESLKDSICIARENKIVAISESIAIYRDDIERDFDYYFDAVIPEAQEGYLIANYSKIKKHNIVGFDLFPILCSSLPDSYDTILQYLESSKLEKDMIVLDLGAYSALSSIAFALAVGKNGKVVAVEPDSINYNCCVENIQQFNTLKNFYNIDLIHAAVWPESRTLFFSGEGCLGSHVISEKNQTRNKLEHVQGITLYDLTKNLQRLDFIKCDIEGAEQFIFKDSSFFDKFRPRLIIELHNCTADCINIFNKHRYQTNVIQQTGVSNMPLLECIPL